MSIITLKGLVFLQTWQLLKELKLLNIRQSYKQEGDCLVHFLRLLAVCWQARKVHETTTFLLATCQIFTDLKKKILTDSTAMESIDNRLFGAINVSRGIVTRCGGTNNNHFAANL